MAFKIPYTKATNADEAYKKVKSIVTPDYARKFANIKTDVSYDDSNKKISATGSGFTLVMNFLDSHCDVDMELSFLLKALKGKIQSVIEDQMKKHI